ncbi:acyl-[acyl-carrier-protein] thioesterase [Leadbettera azotonutricia]|nr:acyl-ACP thioesterase domain-containing protein [Leadbettera azotonutricia]
MLDIIKETTPIRFGDVDRSNRLTLGAAFGYFQEAAIAHADRLGVGFDAFAKIGQGWILSRISVFMEKRPKFGEIVTVESWPRGWDMLFALRDYAIRDNSGKAIARGRANWLILDIEKRRPLRARDIMEKLPLNEGVDAFPAGTLNLKPKEGLAKTGERKAAYSDIDFYGHVNNARYIQWIQDMADPDMLDAADEIRLDINYVSEVLPGETVELWSAPLPALPDAPGIVRENYPASPEKAFAFEGRRTGAKGIQAVFCAELHLGKD